MPGSTCPLDKYPIFQNPAEIFHIYKDYPSQYSDHKYFYNAYKFHSSMFKLPTWYGEDRMNYANEYINAIKKIIANISELK